MKACFISGMLLLTASSYAYNCCDSEPCCEETSCPESYFYVGGDYLYLKAFQEGMDRAGMGPEFIGEIRGIDFKWTNGFRAAAGAEFCSDWGVEGTYTYLRPHGKKTTQGERIYPTTLPGFVAGGSNFSTSMRLQFFFDTGEAQYTSIMSTIKVNYDVYDIDLKKLFYCNSCFDGYVSAGVELA